MRRCLLLLCLALALPRAAAACLDDETEQCLAGVCVCLPDAVLEVSQQAGGMLLEQWLIDTRSRAQARALPIPAEIRRKLERFVDAKALDAARYQIDDGSVLDLATLNQFYGDAVGRRVAAVTLVDVIIFRDAQVAADVTVWAHELFHVKQYREWGVHEFARRYTRNYREVEEPAYAFEAAYVRSNRPAEAGRP